MTLRPRRPHQVAESLLDLHGLPTPLAWATIVIGASLLTPLGFFGFILVPVWLIVVGLWLSRRRTGTPEPTPG